MKRKSISVEPEKVHRLTLAELAAHDDACSDAMVDNAYFKSQIRKNKTKYFPLRIKEDEIPQILLHKVIVQKDVAAAEKELCRVNGLKRYRSGLRSKAEQDNFLRHLRKYIEMYQTDCPWEVSTTNRYTITTYEAAVTARQRVKQGQVIKYLVGTLVPLTFEESADLDHTNRNFSIVVSSRKKNSSIFLGPARFANHDCDANGRLVTRGSDAMEVIAMKNIDIGDEITVSYGDDYFGPGNVDCLCHTCERLVRNGWSAARNTSASPENSAFSSQEPRSPILSSTKRKRESSDSDVKEPTSLRPLKRVRAKPSPSKLQQSWTPTSSVDTEPASILQLVQQADGTVVSENTNTLSQDLALSPPASPGDATSEKENRTVISTDMNTDNEPRRMVTRRQSSGYLASNKDLKSNNPTVKHIVSKASVKKYPLSPASTATPSVESGSSSSSILANMASSENVTIKVESIETSKIEADVTIALEADTPTRTGEEAQQDAVVTTVRTIGVSKSIASPTADTSSVLPSIEPSVPVSIVTNTTTHIMVQPVSDRTRVPGDYSLTRKLLAQPHDRWVQCHNERCQGFFVQPNGYQTRRECPRCERHSMLYGFSWPKLDPDPRKISERSPGSRKSKGKVERSAYLRTGTSGKGSWVVGGGDEEERVMDHRTVHRFVMPKDEKAMTRRGLLNEAEKLRLSGIDLDPVGVNIGARKRTESIGVGSGIDSPGERGSLTPDLDGRRRSRRFVTQPSIYAD